MNRSNYCMVAGWSAGLLYAVDKMAESGRLEAVVLQKPNTETDHNSRLRMIAKKARNLFCDPGKRQASVLSSILPGFRNFHVLSAHREKQLRSLAETHGFDLLFTTSINEDTRIHDYLERSQSRHALVLGGKVLRSVVLNRFNGRWINCHGGLLPYYRGLCSEYWAVKNRDCDKIGWTVHELVERIDAGKILQRGTVSYDPGDTLEKLMIRNHAAMVAAYIRFADALPDSASNPLEHKPGKVNYYSRPDGRAFRRLMRTKVSRL